MITLATLPRATEQQVFDQIATHLLTQNDRALGAGGVCVFLNDNGLKCAAGCLMTEAEFLALPSEIKGGNWAGVAAYMHISEHEHLIAELQTVHDRRTVEQWPDALRTIAGAEKLNPGVLDVART